MMTRAQRADLVKVESSRDFSASPSARRADRVFVQISDRSPLPEDFRIARGIWKPERGGSIQPKRGRHNVFWHDSSRTDIPSVGSVLNPGRFHVNNVDLRPLKCDSTSEGSEKEGSTIHTVQTYVRYKLHVNQVDFCSGIAFSVFTFCCHPRQISSRFRHTCVSQVF
jgi:hypothetical protein